MDLGSFSYSNEDTREKVDSNPASAKRAISWRLPAEESFSDWTIILNIVQRDEGVLEKHSAQDEEKNALQTVFHVHKVFLGAGKRGSLYFDRLFKGGNLRENQNSTSTIEVEHSAALAFPILLDYLYSDSKPLKATTETAVALRWLSTYLGIESVFHEVNKFIRRNFKVFTAPMYCREAALYQDEKVLAQATKFCAENFDRLFHNGETIPLSPEHFSSIFNKAKNKFPSRKLSQVVAKYWKNRREEISIDMIREWTDPGVMDTLAPDSAIPLLHAADFYSLDQDRDGQPSLKQRCIDTASREWRLSLAEMIESRNLIYVDISASTKCEALERALLNANRKLRDVETTYEALRDVLKKLKRVPGPVRFLEGRIHHLPMAQVPNLSEFGLGPLGSEGKSIQYLDYNGRGSGKCFPIFHFEEQ